MAGMTVIRGGRLVDLATRSAPRRDILIRDDTIIEIGRTES